MSNFDSKFLINQWKKVNQEIENINQNYNQSAKLIAVSKTKPLEMIVELAKEGQKDFGENYLQEAINKITFFQTTYPKIPINWHYIGHIQRNKTKVIAENFSWVHTVERKIIAKRLSEQRPSNLPDLNILIQVNIDNEDSKSGCDDTEVTKLIREIKNYPKLQLRGLMVIPAKNSSDSFSRTRSLFERIKVDNPDLNKWDTLSMGMSADMEEAIKFGATFVRVGTAIFGLRH